MGVVFVTPRPASFPDSIEIDVIYEVASGGVRTRILAEYRYSLFAVEYRYSLG
jgi:hypothetical protein